MSMIAVLVEASTLVLKEDVEETGQILFINSEGRELRCESDWTTDSPRLACNGDIESTSDVIVNGTSFSSLKSTVASLERRLATLEARLATPGLSPPQGPPSPPPPLLSDPNYGPGRDQCHPQCADAPSCSRATGAGCWQRVAGTNTEELPYMLGVRIKALPAGSNNHEVASFAFWINRDPRGGGALGSKHDLEGASTAAETCNSPGRCGYLRGAILRCGDGLTTGALTVLASFEPVPISALAVVDAGDFGSARTLSQVKFVASPGSARRVTTGDVRTRPRTTRVQLSEW